MKKKVLYIIIGLSLFTFVFGIDKVKALETVDLTINLDVPSDIDMKRIRLQVSSSSAIHDFNKTWNITNNQQIITVDKIYEGLAYNLMLIYDNDYIGKRTFYVSHEGKIFTDESEGQVTDVLNVKINNQKVKISVKDKDTKKSITGSQFQIYDKNLQEIKGANGKTLYQFNITDEITEVSLLPNRKYYLVEKKPAEGYNGNLINIPFWIDTEGNIATYCSIQNGKGVDSDSSSSIAQAPELNAQDVQISLTTGGNGTIVDNGVGCFINQIEIYNTKGVQQVEVENTSANLKIGITIGGIILVIVGGYVLYKLMKKHQ